MNFWLKGTFCRPINTVLEKNMSTVTQLVTTVHHFSAVLDESGQVHVSFLDFSKAFDKVPHEKLLYKLEHIGLPDCLLNWIRAYLNNRKQYVDINGCFSNFLAVTSGVPQGSVLGPLLFLLYINDLADVVPETVFIRLFADDCVVFREIRSPDDCEVLQESLVAIESWCEQWGMMLNAGKCAFLRTMRKKHFFNFQYFLQNTCIADVGEYKYLGLTLNSNLSWSSHVKRICSAAFTKLCFLRRKLRHSPSHVKLLAYETFVRAKLEYASMIWDPHLKKDIYMLELVQRKAVRFIFNKYGRYDSPSKLMTDNGIQTLAVRRRLARLLFLNNIATSKVKITPSTMIKPLSTRRTRHMHAHSFQPIFAKTNQFKHSFFPRTISEWNALPEAVIQAKNFSQALQESICG